MNEIPKNVHLKKEEALEVTWSDSPEEKTIFPLRFLRKWCPCAGCQGERDILGRQVLPIVRTSYDGPITALGGELVGNYAIRIRFSDGHDSGIFSFRYLKELKTKLESEREK